MRDLQDRGFLSEKLLRTPGPQPCLVNILELFNLAQALLQPPSDIDAEEDTARLPPLVGQAEDALDIEALRANNPVTCDITPGWLRTRSSITRSAMGADLLDHLSI